jgi:hypothetical protein
MTSFMTHPIQFIIKTLNAHAILAIWALAGIKIKIVKSRNCKSGKSEEIISEQAL